MFEVIKLKQFLKDIYRQTCNKADITVISKDNRARDSNISSGATFK